MRLAAHGATSKARLSIFVHPSTPRRVPPSNVQPYGAGPEAGEVDPEDTKLGRSGDHA